jgi:YHS domain-containing protein
MRSIRRHWWAVLSAAALVAGCTSESSDATATPTPASAPDAKSTPEKKAPEPTPAEPKADADKKADDAAKPDMPKIEGPKIEPPKADADKKADAAVKLTDDELAAIKKLPADEQTLAMSQALCPVSGEHLGEMGTPVKVSAEGKTFYLCCKSCQKEVASNPKAVVAKLATK